MSTANPCNVPGCDRPSRNKRKPGPCGAHERAQRLAALPATTPATPDAPATPARIAADPKRAEAIGYALTESLVDGTVAAIVDIRPGESGRSVPADSPRRLPIVRRPDAWRRAVIETYADLDMIDDAPGMVPFVQRVGARPATVANVYRRADGLRRVADRVPGPSHVYRGWDQGARVEWRKIGTATRRVKVAGPDRRVKVVARQVGVYVRVDTDRLDGLDDDMLAADLAVIMDGNSLIEHAGFSEDNGPSKAWGHGFRVYTDPLADEDGKRASARLTRHADPRRGELAHNRVSTEDSRIARAWAIAETVSNVDRRADEPWTPRKVGWATVGGKDRAGMRTTAFYASPAAVWHEIESEAFRITGTPRRHAYDPAAEREKLRARLADAEACWLSTMEPSEDGTLIKRQVAGTIERPRLTSDVGQRNVGPWQPMIADASLRALFGPPPKRKARKADPAKAAARAAVAAWHAAHPDRTPGPRVVEPGEPVEVVAGWLTSVEPLAASIVDGRLRYSRALTRSERESLVRTNAWHDGNGSTLDTPARAAAPRRLDSHGLVDRARRPKWGEPGEVLHGAEFGPVRSLSTSEIVRREPIGRTGPIPAGLPTTGIPGPSVVSWLHDLRTDRAAPASYIPKIAEVPDEPYTGPWQYSGPFVAAPIDWPDWVESR